MARDYIAHACETSNNWRRGYGAKQNTLQGWYTKCRLTGRTHLIYPRELLHCYGTDENGSDSEAHRSARGGA